ncbi:MAG TPA: hypothetical protein ENO24_00240 [Chloroflexi bacterium]|nr:hypothetical protein [Chloroflexota bacterium]
MSLNMHDHDRKPDLMSKGQQMTLGFLGVAVILVYGLLGAYALIELTQPGITQNTADGQAASIGPDDTGPGPATVISDTSSLSESGPGAVVATNTRVVPVGSPAPVSTTTDVSAPSTWTAQPADSAALTPVPPSPTATVAPSSPTPPSAPPAPPAPDASCADEENSLHLQRVADIEAQYEPHLTWLEDEIKQAERDRDYLQLEDLRWEYELYQEMKASDLSAENERHEAALAACAS